MSDDRTNEEKYVGLTYWQAMALMFVGLKMAGAIEWHWACVLIPHYMLIVAWLLPPTVRAFIKTIKETK